jgi:hypothetical protein
MDLSRHWPGGPEEKRKNINHVVSVLDEIRTKTPLESRYTVSQTSLRARHHQAMM